MALQVDSPTPTDVAQPWKVEPNDIAEEVWILDEPLQAIISGGRVGWSALVPASPVQF